MPYSKYIISLALLLATFQLHAQSKVLVSTGFIIGFNNNTTMLWEYEVENFTTSGVFFQAGYSYYFLDKFYLSVEPGIQQYYDKVKINNVDVKIYGFNLELPFSLGYAFHNKWEGFLGYSLQNYREMDDMELLKSNNIRENVFIGTRYQLSKHWAAYFRYSRMVSKQVDYLTAKQLENQFFLGISFCFGGKVKEGSME